MKCIKSKNKFKMFCFCYDSVELQVSTEFTRKFKIIVLTVSNSAGSEFEQKHFLYISDMSDPFVKLSYDNG